MSMFSRKLDNLGQKISYGVLVLALVLGGSLRSEEVERDFGVNNGFSFFFGFGRHVWAINGDHIYFLDVFLFY